MQLSFELLTAIAENAKEADCNYINSHIHFYCTICLLGDAKNVEKKVVRQFELTHVEMLGQLFTE